MHLDRAPLAELLLDLGCEVGVRGGWGGRGSGAEQGGQFVVQAAYRGAVDAGELGGEPGPHRVDRSGSSAFGRVGGAEVGQGLCQVAGHLVDVRQREQAFGLEGFQLVALGAVCCVSE
ncbi:hypothetical protein ALI22I_27995 [Saccharothrix sp. ALI-22-I]|nr:hypothetical protein ALI22I_27995 [Saccharothrix sp. ALI-22-I]